MNLNVQNANKEFVHIINYKQEVLMNPQHNSLDAQNVNTLGEITHKV